MQVMEQLTLPNDKPKSFIVFMAGLLAGLFIFLPLIIAGLSLEKTTLMLVGATGLAIVWLPAAYMCLLFAARLAAGYYKELQAKPWKEQVW